MTASSNYMCYHAGRHFSWDVSAHAMTIIMTTGAWTGLIIIVLQCCYNVCIPIKKKKTETSLHKRFLKNLADVGMAH